MNTMSLCIGKTKMNQTYSTVNIVSLAQKGDKQKIGKRFISDF